MSIERLKTALEALDNAAKESIFSRASALSETTAKEDLLEKIDQLREKADKLQALYDVLPEKLPEGADAGLSELLYGD